jgi:hypothetical protein
MNSIKVTRNNLIIVAVTALKLVLNDFINWGMKAAVQHDYPDLESLVRFVQVEEEDVSLLKGAKNPISRLFLKYATIISDRLMLYLKLFGMDQVIVDNSACKYANEVYARLVYENPMYLAEDLDIDLELFAYSVIHTMYCLCELVINGNTNLDAAFDHGSSYDQVMEGTWDNYCDHDNHEYKLVANLMQDACQFYDELTDLLLRRS